ncbi:uncharacterized protein DS421_19g672120 [Arachis hypogaea]|uniref:Uncharacterized protein n=1 Tax=Arachis hypogaea TaxID=3818 RepID=A0A6B9VDQ7_ARAHY|nr:uncharacterized protein DS421_19g672120 [Arachis hypogaea]
MQVMHKNEKLSNQIKVASTPIPCVNKFCCSIDSVVIHMPQIKLNHSHLPQSSSKLLLYKC